MRVAVGSSGKLYAQVANGAPFDVLLAADDERPRRLAAEGLGLAETRFTYATGRLVLWSAAPDRIGTDGAETLRVGAFRHLAIANPALAPYGRAARETLVALGLWEGLKDRIVQGEDVGQAFAMAASANAEIGLVALASVRGARGGPPGSRWEVPSALHAPIRQEAILLLPGKDNPAALAFLDFLKGDDARALIRRFGYDVD